MAPGEHVAPNEFPIRHALWLSVRLRRENWLFEIGPDEERAIVVGSLLRAHVRINRRDVAPVHFHFEREGDRVRVCPAYGADLCVNGTPISGPHELDAHATIAFGGLELETYVCDVEPDILEQLDLRDWTAEELPDCGAVMSLPDGAEVTRAIQRLSVEPRSAATETKKYAPLCDSYLQQEKAAIPSSADQAETREATVSSARESILPSPVVPVGIARRATEASPNSDCESTLPGVHVTVRVAAAESQASEPQLSIDDFPSTAPVCADSTNQPIGLAESPLARLGLVVRERPLAATLIAACSAALLSLAMLAADRLVTDNARGLPPGDGVALTPHPTVAATELPSAAVSSAPLSQTTEGAPEVAIVPPPSPSGLVHTGERGAVSIGSPSKSPAHAAPGSSTHAVNVRPLVRSGL